MLFDGRRQHPLGRSQNRSFLSGIAEKFNFFAVKRENMSLPNAMHPPWSLSPKEIWWIKGTGSMAGCIRRLAGLAQVAQRRSYLTRRPSLAKGLC